MKHIQKAGAPHDYIAWCNQVRGTANENYRCLQNPEKASLQTTLLEEQGFLCAYTMRRIDENSAHIEHIKPEYICRTEQAGFDLTYGNLIACFPRDGMHSRCRYGAQQKGDWWDDDGVEFVSPLNPSCEARFQFDLNGKITAIQDHPAALTTIRVLKLDHPSLTEDRMRVIQEFVYGKTGQDALSKAQALRAISSVCDRNARGKFYEFCVAIKDAIAEHVRQLEKIANRRRFSKGT